MTIRLTVHTVGELYDLLDGITRAEEAVESARLSIRHGGNADTMRWKHQALADAESYVETLRNRSLLEE
jgi:hypothetical protein